MSETRCSFCNRTRAEAGPMVASARGAAAICGPCLALATAEALPLAHCHACVVEDGKRAQSCPERLTA